MAAQLGNYVLETATSPGTGDFTLNGAEANRRPFSAAFPNGGNVLYFADDGSQAEWGIGALTVGTPSTLARSTVLGNTAGTKVALNFPGSVEVYNEIPAEMVPVLEQDGSLTLAGGLTVKGKVIVQNVDDFTSQEPVPAKQADSRYIRNNAYINGGVVALDLDGAGTGDLSYQRADGSWSACQRAGDYATNTALSAETTRATKAESNLQSSKVNRDGDTMADTLTITGPTTGVDVISDANNGSGFNDANITFHLNKRFGYSGVVGLRENVGSSLIMMLSAYNGSSWYEFDFVAQGANQGRFTSPAGVSALTSDLPLDANQRIQSFSVSIADGGSIAFPVAFSGVPSSIQLQCMQTGARLTRANPTANPTASGIPSVGVQIVAGDHTQTVTTPITVWVTAIGPK